MGKIVAIGGGRYDNGEIISIFQHIISLSGKSNPKVVYLPTAGFDYIIGDEPIINSFRQYGCTVTALLLTDVRLSERDIEDEIMSADIIYAGGGNLKFLMNTWKSTKADKYLKKAYEKGTILSGYSSGAMCWFKEGWDDCGEDHSFMFIDCMDLLPYCNCPHFDSDNWQHFKDEIKTRDISGLAVDNGAAVIFDGDKMYTIRGNDGGDVFIFDKDKNFEQIKISE